MDGRTQIPVINYMKTEYVAEYVDMITEAGPNKILAEHTNKSAIESIKLRVSISTEKHDSKVIAVVGHFDCGGNPSDEETQIQQIREAVKIVEGWNSNVEVIGLWVDAQWRVNKVSPQFTPVSIDKLIEMKKL